MDKPVARTPRRRVALAAAAALAIAVTGSQAAFAQSGGVGSPGTTTTPPPTTTPSGYPQVFPLPGAHSYGDGFGAARSGHSHQGQDIMAACGEPLVAVSRARVKRIAYQSAAGNYILIRNKKLKQDYFYAHVASATVAKGQVVTPGQQIGTVGDTGNARACHLHFELWVGKWYRGGHPVNPITYLQNWDSYS